MTVKLVLIAAVAKNGVIGKDNAIPWRLPEDLRRFKELTMGHPILMGRKTWQSLGRPLPGRRNLVVSRDANFPAADAEVFVSVQAAIAACPDGEEIYVIGGSQIYAETLPLADRLEMTEIDRDFEGDTFFPPIDRQTWLESHREHHRGTQFAYDFVVYKKVPSPRPPPQGRG